MNWILQNEAEYKLSLKLIEDKVHRETLKFQESFM